MLIFKDKATFSSLSEIHQPLQQGLETEYQQVAAIAIKSFLSTISYLH